MKTTTTRIDAIREILYQMTDSEIVAIHNAYCNAAMYYDDCVYSMEDFDEIMYGKTPWEIARCSYYSGNFCPAHNWFWFNGYGNLESSDRSPDIIDLDEIAVYIDTNDESLDYDEIQNVLDMFESMNEHEID